MAAVFGFAVFEFVDALSRVLVEALLNGLWQGLLIVALVWLLLRVSPRVSATTRHAVWFVSLLAVSLLPVFTAVNTWRKGATTAAANNVSPDLTTAPPAVARSLATNQVTPPPVTTTSLPLIAYQTSVPRSVKPVELLNALPAQPTTNAAPVAKTVMPAPASWQAIALRWLSARLLGLLVSWLPLALALIWAAGSALMLSRLAGSYWALFKLRRNLTDVSAEIATRVEQLSVVYGISRELRVTASTEAHMPMTIGWRKPLIILPHDLSQTLTQAECDSVMAHELAHIKRHDYATNFAQRLAQCVYFFHPAIWFVGKQLVIERELACDDWAVKLTGEPRRYAGCLTKLVELLSESKPLLAATGILFGKHIITRRVEMILNRDRNATTSVSKPALAYAIVLAALCVGVCSALSPVIAVPKAQKPQEKVAKPVAPKAPKATSPAVPNAPDAPAAPALADDLLELEAPLGRIEINGELIELPAPADLVDISERALDIARDFQWQDAPAAIAPAAPAFPASPIAPLAYVPSWDKFDGLAELAGQQSGEKKAPAIPEDEMLKLLADIVRRDADANVRAEALAGIYRLRSDAAINTLIQLYDQVTDVKTKGDILARLIRRTGDNSKAIAKLVQVVKTEKDETLVSRALGSLGYLKGDEGADQLVSIYDSLSDAKLKQRVIRSLGYNKGKKAIEKLMAIAKGDSDPTLRQAALRALSNLDGNSFDLGSGIAVPGSVGVGKAFNFNGQNFEFDRERMKDIQRDAEDRMREAQERMRDAQERMRYEIERKGARSRGQEDSTPAPADQAPATGSKKPTALAPKVAPKPAITGGIAL